MRGTHRICVGVACFLLLAACGSSGPKLVTQTGTVVAYVACSLVGAGSTPVAGATVTVGANSTTTAKDGTYSLGVPQGEPFTMMVIKDSDPSYVQLLEEEDTVQANYNRGYTQLIDSDTAMLLSAALTGYDDTRSLITVELVKTGTCTDVGGTTVSVSDVGTGAVTLYPSTCADPAAGGPSATDGVFPAAVVYNATPGTHTFAATSPKCTQAPFPYTDPTNGLTYDGSVETQSGTGTSFVRIFLK